MKLTKITFPLVVSVLTLTLYSCDSMQQQPAPEDVAPVEEVKQPEEEQTIRISGIVTSIENGKDGYMATIKAADGQEYIATISVVNLNKYGGTYKKKELNDSVTVAGPTWADAEGKKYIMAKELE
ncbi:hypothetical protein [Gynurincola endophyticus]|jgi:hypothetical protein|uniref:hypothetical protein n=1 Tax=Gynurincola endophyticus TaxID=2479004 RepID=UPI000F8EDBE1|nr:hypothetical protein [Gynurincola endophyticus]